MAVTAKSLKYGNERLSVWYTTDVIYFYVNLSLFADKKLYKRIPLVPGDTMQRISFSTKVLRHDHKLCTYVANLNPSATVLKIA